MCLASAATTVVVSLPGVFDDDGRDPDLGCLGRFVARLRDRRRGGRQGEGGGDQPDEQDDVDPSHREPPSRKTFNIAALSYSIPRPRRPYQRKTADLVQCIGIGVQLYAKGGRDLAQPLVHRVYGRSGGDGKEAGRRVGDDDVARLGTLMASQPVDTHDDREERVVEGVAADDRDQLVAVLREPEADVFEGDVAPTRNRVADDDAAVRDVVGERAVERSLAAGRCGAGPGFGKRDPINSKPTTPVTESMISSMS